LRKGKRQNFEAEKKRKEEQRSDLRKRAPPRREKKFFVKKKRKVKSGRRVRVGEHRWKRKIDASGKKAPYFGTRKGNDRGKSKKKKGLRDGENIPIKSNIASSRSSKSGKGKATKFACAGAKGRGEKSRQHSGKTEGEGCNGTEKVRGRGASSTRSL